MNREKYRKAFDQIPFSADFQARTAALLHSRAQETQTLEKEKPDMKVKWIRKPAVLAAAAALLVLSVSAAALWPSPAQVAELAGQPVLASAFEGENAITLNETVETGDFSVTLLGLVSGAGLTEQNVDASHTYAVVALNRLDGTPLDQENFDFIKYTLTPLVSGFSPLAVNNWTLGSFATGIDMDGTYCYLLDTQDLGMFADHTVYLAFYEGLAPSNEVFSVAEDGSISFAEDFDGVHALFTLPLDASLADPAAADAFVESTELNHWSNGDGESDAKADTIFFGTADSDAGGNAEILYGSSVFYELSADEYEAYVEETLAQMKMEVEKGFISQEDYDQAESTMTQDLAGVKNGSLTACRMDENGAVFTFAQETAGE